MSQSSAMDELQRVEQRTTRDGKREVEILDWERVNSGDTIEITFITQPEMDVETVEMDWPATKSPSYRFVRIVNGFGYSLDQADRIKGKSLMATVDEEGDWSLIVPDNNVPAHIQQRADQIRDGYACLRSRVFGSSLSLNVPLTSDVEVDAGKPVRAVGHAFSLVASAALFIGMLPIRAGRWLGARVKTAALVAHVLFPYRTVRKGIEAGAAMFLGVGLGTAVVLLICLSLYSSAQGRDEAIALSDQWFARFFGIGAVVKFPALIFYIFLHT